jgi:signal transduction histidine kinase
MSLQKILNLSRLVSIRWRLTILFVTIFGTTLVLFAIFIFNFLATTLQREFDDALFNYAVDVNESISLDSNGDLSFQNPAFDKGKLYPFALGTALIQIRNKNGEALSRVGDFGSLNVPYHTEVDKLNKGEEEAFRTITKLEGLPNKEAEEYRMVTLPIDNSPVPQLLLQVAVPMTLLEDQIASRKRIMEISFPVALLIAIVGGYLLSMRALQPVTEMILTTKAIGGEKLSARLSVPVVNDEIQALALSLNEMLARIERAFESQERFIADASHQLLTPLTIMRGEIESALRRNEFGKPLLESTLQEVGHLSQIVQQLLLLARVEAGKSALQFSSVALDEVVFEAVGRANRSALQKNIRIQFNINNSTSTQVRPLVHGDFDLLQNLVYNLIENAVKYSKSDEVVRVELHWHDHFQLLKIEDSGPGIPETQLSLIFERFHRAPSREEGHGLGLAIAKKIADGHSAKLWVENKYLNSLDKTEKSGCCFFFEIKNI